MKRRKKKKHGKKNPSLTIEFLGASTGFLRGWTEIDLENPVSCLFIRISIINSNFDPKTGFSKSISVLPHKNPVYTPKNLIMSGRGFFSAFFFLSLFFFISVFLWSLNSSEKHTLNKKKCM